MAQRARHGSSRAAGRLPAPLSARLVAALLDGIWGIAVVAYVVRDDEGRPWPRAMLTARGGVGVWCGVGWLYAVLTESSRSQATLGKVVMSVRVEPVGGGRVGRYPAAVRNALRLVDLQPCLLYLVGAHFARRSPLRRASESAAGTWVVRHRFPLGARIACLLTMTLPVVALVNSVRRRDQPLDDAALR